MSNVAFTLIAPSISSARANYLKVHRSTFMKVSKLASEIRAGLKSGIDIAFDLQITAAKDWKRREIGNKSNNMRETGRAGKVEEGRGGTAAARKKPQSAGR